MIKYILIIFFLCLTSCKTTDYNPWTTIVKQAITNGMSK